MIKYKIIMLLATTALNISILQAQLKVTTGGVLFNNGATLTLNDMSLQNDGSINQTGNAVTVFSGFTNQEIKGTGSYNFYGIKIDKTAGAKMIMNKSIKVNGPLIMNSGRLDLGNNNIELVYPAGLIVNESEANRIVTGGTGEVFITQILNNPLAVNPGNLGAVITSSQNLGATTIRRGHKADSINGQPAIARYYKVQPTYNSNLNASLRFNYFDAQLNNIPETSLVIFSKPAAQWNALTKDAFDMGVNFIQKNNIASFDMYTLGNGTGVAPSYVADNTTFAKKEAGRNTVLAKPDIASKDVITVGTNPTTGQLNIGMHMLKSEKILFRIMDIKGSIVMQKRSEVLQGANIETLQLDNLTRGAYLVQIINADGFVQSFRIVKQ